MKYTPAQLALLEAAKIPGNVAELIRWSHEVDDEAAAMEARLEAPGALLNAALWYASQGALVFPCRPGLKTPATRHGFKEATTDPNHICQWWTMWPEANVGLATGHLFDVLDIDGTQGYWSLGELRGKGLLDEPTLGVSKTPHGTHIFYAPSGDGNTTALAPGVDYRGIGGYVLAPPSRLGAGGKYRWVEPINLGAVS